MNSASTCASPARWLRTGLLAAALAVTASGCSPAPEATPSPSAPASPSPSPALVPAAPGTPLATLRGYYEAREVGLFTPCDETRRRRVERMSDAAKALLAQGERAEARFVAARGERVGSNGVAIDGIELVSGMGWDCDSRFDGFHYAARGTSEPWSLEVTSAAVSFADAPGAPPLVVPYQRFARTDDGVVFADAGESLRVSLHEKPCADRLGDVDFSLTARVEVGGRVYEGCAWRGEAEP